MIDVLEQAFIRTIAGRLGLRDCSGRRRRHDSRGGSFRFLIQVPICVRNRLLLRRADRCIDLIRGSAGIWPIADEDVGLGNPVGSKGISRCVQLDLNDLRRNPCANKVRAKGGRTSQTERMLLLFSVAVALSGLPTIRMSEAACMRGIKSSTEGRASGPTAEEPFVKLTLNLSADQSLPERLRA
ncbi:hypothetical protein AU476_01025 [Cupriavidus sp. UYMSc13B]|nr:hypothetical protein AU476_01025 [Cupriavidus sp. UYMSc13B]